MVVAATPGLSSEVQPAGGLAYRATLEPCDMKEMGVEGRICR